MYLVSGNRHEGEDLAQEAMVKVYERWERVRAMEDPAGYLFRIGLNARRSRLRRIATAAKRALDRPDADPIDASDERDAIRRALRALPPGQREALVLTEWLEMTDEEASGVLGVKPVTVRVRVSRARPTLRRLLRGEDDG